MKFTGKNIKKTIFCLLLFLSILNCIPRNFIFYLLSIVLCYKLITYLYQNFTIIIKNNSKSDIVFLCMFLIFLFLPISNINKDEVSLQENRTLAKWKPLISKHGTFNYKFSKNFENWFNDRFFLRTHLIKFSSILEYLSSEANSKGIICRKNHFLYTNTEINCKISKLTLKRVFETLMKFEKYLSSKNIKFYILIVPSKNFVYPPPEINIQEDYLEEINRIRDKTGLKIIYPLEELRQEKNNDYMYFRTDHHWTDGGTFIGYKELMKVIKKDFPQLNILSENDFNYIYRKDVKSDFYNEYSNGQTCQYLNLSENICNKFLINDYKYYIHKNFNKRHIKITDTPNYKGKDFYYPQGTDLKVVLFGTSMSENLCNILPFSFKYTRRIRNNNVQKIPYNERFKFIKYFKNKTLEYKPDIFIMCIAIWNIEDQINKILEE